MLAFALLVFSFVVLITAFQGAGRETPFTSEHFTAMFLAQKVMEDIAQRTAENPHFFTELVRDAEGEAVPVVDGHSKYFRLLENTRNFNQLLPEEDDPITGGDLYEQLKPFQVKVSTRLQEDPVTGGVRRNLVLVEIHLTWTSKEGLARDYRLAQFIQGNSDDLLAEDPQTTLSPAAQARLDQLAVAALAKMMAADVPALAGAVPGQFTVEDLAGHSPGAQPAALLEVGRMLTLVDGTLAEDDRLSTRIAALEVERDAVRAVLQKSDKSAADQETCLRFLDLQKRIAALCEQKGVADVGHLLLLERSLPALAPIFADPQVLGTLVSRYTPMLMAILSDAEEIAHLTILAFSSAEKCYLSMVSPPVISVLPRRKEPAYLRKALDIQKVGILMESRDGEARQRLADFTHNLDLFQRKYRGQHPNFTDFLTAEQKLAASLASLRAAYAGIVKAFRTIGTQSDRIQQIVRSVPGQYSGR
ncbi:MAG: hypothetical protein GX442_17635 [Candidatus Riflebacteria bacterium]|nr:hypothetical protein [Candidatus Riflebacteria bacterium]